MIKLTEMEKQLMRILIIHLNVYSGIVEGGYWMLAKSKSRIGRFMSAEQTIDKLYENNEISVQFLKI